MSVQLTTHYSARAKGGSLNPNWRGGITPKNKAIRSSPEYKAWRIAVFERDKYACQICGQVGWMLHAHHLVPFSVDAAGRLDVANGQTLCEPCHHATDSFLGKAKTKAIPSTTANNRFRFRSRKNFRAYMHRQMRSWLWSANYCRCACGYWFKSSSRNDTCKKCVRNRRGAKTHTTCLGRTMKAWLAVVHFYRCSCGLWFETGTTRRRCLDCNRKHGRASNARTYVKKRSGSPRLCSVDGCEAKHQSRGYCGKHLSRFKRHGDPLVVKKGGRRHHTAVVPSRPDISCFMEQLRKVTEG